MNVLDEVGAERESQDARWGAFHDDHHTTVEWWLLLRERNSKIRKAVEIGNYVDLRKQLVIMAALSIAAIESMDRKAVSGGTFHPTHSE
jgi:hypothetical protein